MNIMTKDMLDEILDKKGYFIKTDFDADGIQTYTSYGLKDVGNRFDLQLKCGFLPEEKAIFILEKIIEVYMNRYMCIGTDLFNVPELGFKVVLKYISDKSGDILLRCIIPDEKLRYPWNKDCDSEFKNQWSTKDDATYTHITYMISRFGIEYQNLWK